MGVFKKYSPAIACDALRLLSWVNSNNDADRRRPVPNWYDITGTMHNVLLGTTSGTNANDRAEKYVKNLLLTGYNLLTPVATEDELKDFNVYDYSITPIGTTTFNQSVVKSETAMDSSIAIRIVNSSEESVTIKCIKFKKILYVGSPNSSYNAESYETLYCAYFLDESEWITIPAGESRNIVVDFASIVA